MKARTRASSSWPKRWVLPVASRPWHTPSIGRPLMHSVFLSLQPCRTLRYLCSNAQGLEGPSFHGNKHRQHEAKIREIGCLLHAPRVCCVLMQAPLENYRHFHTKHYVMLAGHSSGHSGVASKYHHNRHSSERI